MFKSINGGILPQRATKYSAGFDVYANEDVTIGAGETVLVGLGIALDLERDNFGEPYIMTGEYAMSGGIKWLLVDYYFELHHRSSLRAKGLGGGVGIIDIDYRDEIKMVISNPIYAVDIEDGCNVELGIGATKGYEIKKGEKIGQLILKRHEGYLMPSEYTKDEERNGGFGSTDKVNQ